MKQKLKNIIPIVIFPFIQFGLLGPMEIYSANYLEFVAISKWTVFFEVLIASLLGILIVSTILMILKTKILDFFLKIIFSVTLVSYLQYLFLNSHITDLTGNGISWDSEFYKKLMIENLVAWIIAISLVFTTLLVLKQKGKSVAVVLSSILSIMQIVAVASILITVPAGSNDSYRVSSEGTFDIASDGNILVLVIDSYGNELFDSYMEENPEELDQLKDFTYFNNCDCHYHRTLPSMTHMITGYNVENYIRRRLS